MKTLRKTLVSAAVLASVLAGAPAAGAGGIDEFEPNSKRDLAMQIFAGQRQLHTISPDGDEDWVMFVPRRCGRYVLRVTNVTADLEGELWIQAGRDKEKRVEKFEIPRGRDGELLLEVDSTIGYFKLGIEADDDDDVGRYRVSVQQVSAYADRAFNLRRPDVFESDNRREIAVGILDNTPQLHTIYPRDDEDWVLFAPDRAGEYLLKISNLTTDLKGELWVRRGDDKERRIDKFDVSGRGGTISLHADHRVRYFKIRIQADDDDETGDYRLDVVARSITARPIVPRTIVIRPRPITPPIHRHPGHYRRSVGIIPRILGSVLVDTGKVKIGVGVGRAPGIAPRLGRSKAITDHGHSHSRSRTTTPIPRTVRRPVRRPTRTMVRTPSRTPTRTTTPTRGKARTPTQTPIRPTVRTPGRTPTRTTSRRTTVTPRTNASERSRRTKAGRHPAEGPYLRQRSRREARQ